MRKLAKFNVVYILCLVFSIVFITGNSTVAESVEADKYIDLTISSVYDGNILPDAEFSIFKIGDTDFNGVVNLEKEFEKYPVNITENNIEQWNEYADTLKSYTVKDSKKPLHRGKTDSSGKLSFKVERGIYLVVGKDFESDGFRYRTNPFIVLLPEIDEKTGKYIYETVSTPKFVKEKIPPEKEKTPPEREKTPRTPSVKKPNPKTPNSSIPQTGQLWWPVYMFSGIGIISILLGFIKEKLKGDKNEE